MVDIHTHILPGVDDGANGIDESLAMLEYACGNEITHIVLTPHANGQRYPNFYDASLQEQFLRLETLARTSFSALKLYRGMEILASKDLTELLNAGKLITLNHSRYFLVEFVFGASALTMHSLMTEPLAAGYVPIIAHPERYLSIQRDYSIAREFFLRGCLLQINDSSLSGMFGRAACDCARTLLDCGLIDVVASDAHDLMERNCDLSFAENYITGEYSYEEARRILYKNPLLILEDKEILRRQGDI